MFYSYRLDVAKDPIFGSDYLFKSKNNFVIYTDRGCTDTLEIIFSKKNILFQYCIY